MSYLSNRRRMEEIQRRNTDEVQYRLHKRAYDNGQQRLQAVIRETSEKAVRAEKEGRHNEAVKLAAEVNRLKRYQRATSQVGAGIETARAVSQVGRAMADIARTSERIAGVLIAQHDPIMLSEAQVNLAMTNETMQMMLEQGDLMLDGMDDYAGDGTDETGEACLRSIMAENSRSQDKNLLAETNRKLDSLRKARIEEKP